jgi:hypothetical protein
MRSFAAPLADRLALGCGQTRPTFLLAPQQEFYPYSGSVSDFLGLLIGSEKALIAHCIHPF